MKKSSHSTTFKQSQTIAGIPQVSVFLFLAATAVCLPFALLIEFWPNTLISMIEALGVASRDKINEKVSQLFVDILLLFVVLSFGIAADALCRLRLGKSLVNALFFNNPNRANTVRYRMCALAASIIGFVIILDFFLMGRDQQGWLYMEDGPMETFTALSFAVGGSMMIWTAATQFLKPTRNTPKFILCAGSLFGLALILVALEEISWGQRIFGIETPELLNEVNTQQEFNLHNIFTDYFKYAYFVVAMIVFGVTWKSFLIWVNRQKFPFQEYLPNAMLIVLAAQILCFSFHLMFNELVEPIAAMYILLFCWQLCRPFWGPNPTIKPATKATDVAIG